VSSAVLSSSRYVAAAAPARTPPAGVSTTARRHSLHIVTKLTRYPELDIARGVLLALMISSHAVGLANVPADGFLRSTFWLPRGWSTVGFQILTGFTIGLVLAAADRRKQRAVWIGAARMLAVMVGSNVVLLACKHMVWGELWRLRDPAWWIGAATLSGDASISVVLAPTILLLAATPWLLALERRISSGLFAALVAVAFMGGWASYGASPAAFPGTGVGWAILPLAGNGLVGLALGSWWSRHKDVRRSFDPRVASFACVCLLVLVASLSPAPLVQMTLGTILRFGAILMLAVTMFGAGPGRPLVRGLSQLGRHSLSVFILHRPVIQGFQLTIAEVHLSASVRYVFLYPATLGCMVVLCMLRDRDARVDRMLRAVHL
jgi:hypothetical protein